MRIANLLGLCSPGAIATLPPYCIPLGLVPGPLFINVHFITSTIEYKHSKGSCSRAPPPLNREPRPRSGFDHGGEDNLGDSPTQIAKKKKIPSRKLARIGIFKTFGVRRHAFMTLVVDSPPMDVSFN